MRIRAEQMDAFGPLAEADFEGRVVEHLLKEHGDEIVDFPRHAFVLEDLPEDTLRQLVRRGIERARGYGLTWEYSIAEFVVLTFVVAPNFDRHPLIKRALEDEAVQPDERLDMMWERVSDETWAVAEDEYDPHAWEVSPPEDDAEDASASAWAAARLTPARVSAAAPGATAVCPECLTEIAAGGGAAAGDLVICEECEVSLEVVEVAPLEFALRDEGEPEPEDAGHDLEDTDDEEEDDDEEDDPAEPPGEPDAVEVEPDRDED